MLINKEGAEQAPALVDHQRVEDQLHTDVPAGLSNTT